MTLRLAPGQVIAIVGLSAKVDRPSYAVARALRGAGFVVLPVNPIYAGETILGELCVSSVLEIERSVDIVNCFRNSDEMPAVAREVVAMTPRAKVLWMQLGIENPQARIIAEGAGMEVIENRCIMVAYFSQH